MPSLKALRNRIASVKATQKITKAMQMVAAAKLRRAQEAAIAARPYAERMSSVLANIAASTAGQPGAPALIAGTGQGGCASPSRRDGRARPRRRLQQRHRAPRARRCAPAARGRQDGQVLRRRPQGLRHPAAAIRRRSSSSASDFRQVKQISFVEAKQVADRLLAMFEEGAFDVATLYYSRFRSVISQVPTAQRIIPAEVPAGIAAPDRSAARSTNTSPTRRRSWPSSCRATSPSRYSRRCWRTPPRSTARR